MKVLVFDTHLLLRLITLLFVLQFIIFSPSEADKGGSQISISLDPAGSLSIFEGEQTAVVVTAYYSGPSKQIELNAFGLPSFIDGWQNKDTVCHDCYLIDTMIFNPDNCDYGEYDLIFEAFVNNDNRTADSALFHLSVIDVDNPCSLSGIESISVSTGEEIRFEIKALDYDTICGNQIETLWNIDGYPISHGAEIIKEPWRSVFSWIPAEDDEGSFPVHFEFNGGGGNCTKTVMIYVNEYDCTYPVIVQEPEFTRGTSNEICFVPACGAYTHEICYYDSLEQVLLGCTILDRGQTQAFDDTVCLTIENLLDGRTYKYYVTAYFLGDPITSTFSGHTYSTQDNSPPNSVINLEAIQEIGGELHLTWDGVEDDVSFVDYYELYRKHENNEFIQIDIIPASPDNDKYLYTDFLGGPTGLEEGLLYYYTMSAVDIVGNRGEGNITLGVIPDSTPPCIPELQVEYDYQRIVPDFEKFKQGIENTVWGRTNCTGIEEAFEINFQVVRDSTKFFETGWNPGAEFFDSDWLIYPGDSMHHNFNFLPNANSDTGYVNGHRYIYRARARDSLGNTSSWSPVNFSNSAFQDAYPPDDIRNLVVLPVYVSEDDHYAYQLSWDHAVDNVSGLKEYHIYRKIDDGQFTRIATTDLSSSQYYDPGENFRVVDKICYRVGSADRVGNIRTYEQTDWEACLRSYDGPIPIPECDATISDTCYSSQETILIKWEAYNPTSVLKYYIRINEFLDSTGERSYLADLPNDDLYLIRLKAEFSNGLSSTWSEPVPVKKDATPPDPVDDLFAFNIDDSPDGFIHLTWSPAFDLNGIGHYIVVKDDTDEFIAYDTIYVDSTIDSVYAVHSYTVRSVDLVGNIQYSGNNSAESYFNPAPETIKFDTLICNIDLYTKRSKYPNRAIDYHMQAYTYILDSGILVDSTAVANDTVLCIDVPKDNYCIRAREIPQGLDDSYEYISAWSDSLIVPLVGPSPVSNLIAQPQPIHPDSSCGSILLDWEYNHNRPEVDRLKICRYETGDSEWCVEIPFPADSFVDNCALPKTDYTYYLTLLTIYGSQSDSVSINTRLDPLSMYTPRILPIDVEFTADSAYTLYWDWLDSDSNRVGNIYGAVTCSLEASIDNSFKPHQTVGITVPADYMQADLPIGSLTMDTDRTVYFRIMAGDNWNNSSFWSEVYYPNDSIKYDNVPPSAVNELQVVSHADTTHLEGRVDARLTWLASSDNNGSGLKQYYIYIIRNNQDSSRHDSTVNNFYHHDDVNPADYNFENFVYVVAPVDNLGNINFDPAQGVPFRYLPPPTIKNISGLNCLEWSYSGTAVDRFCAECAKSISQLGDSIFIDNFYSDSMFGYFGGVDRFGCFGYDVLFEETKLYCHMKAVKDNFESSWSELFIFNDDSLSGSAKPGRTELLGNYPNPFNPVTKIAFNLANTSRVELKIYNIIGETVKVLRDHTLPAGEYQIIWDGTSQDGYEVATGMYFYQLKTDNHKESRKMLLIR